ncbi:trichohyalin-like [Bactrocera neohumeralis]|uniref:trichohyalin-like n=1 Tax=Bactrocera neohumeralis TaxID=98809 RepID=UPI002165E6A1|nr:trichohyalin-like [Bactrocera neohumeralis]
MPPLMRSYSGAARDTSSLVLAAASDYGPFGAAAATVSPLSLWAVDASGPGRCTTSSRYAEASLLRRELELRGEFHRLRAEESEQMRLRQEQDRREADAEERRHLIAAARDIEEQRAKRMEEQQEKILQRERELRNGRWNERRVEELKGHQASQLRDRNEQINTLETKLAQMERELQEAKAKIALTSVGNANDPYGFGETTKLKDEIRDLRQKADELEEQKKRLERRQRESDERADAQSAALQSIQNEYQSRARHNEAEVESLRKEAQQAKSALDAERAAHEDELARLRKQIREAEEVAVAQKSRDAEVTLQKMRERFDNDKQGLEAAQHQLTRKLKATEEELQSTKRQLESTQRELSTAKVDLQQRGQTLEEKTALLKKLEGDVESKASLEFELRDAKSRMDHIAEEHKRDRDYLQAQHQAALSSKEKDVETLRKELAESRKLVQSLREEVTNSKFGKDDYQQKLNRDLSEKEASLAQLRRELEASKHSQEEWKATYEDPQRQKERAAESFEQNLRARDEEVRSVSEKLNKALEEKVAAELALRSRKHGCWPARHATARRNGAARARGEPLPPEHGGQGASRGASAAQGPNRNCVMNSAWPGMPRSPSPACLRCRPTIVRRSRPS